MFHSLSKIIADEQYDFVMSLPDGFDTEVGGKGSQLSGGQVSLISSKHDYG